MRKKDQTMAAAHDSRRKSEDGLWETVKVIIQALLIAFFVRSFLYQPFNIPSASMYPTLKIGDYLFVSKLSYGYGKYSFNFSLGGFGHEILNCCPIDFPGRAVLADTPKRGDVAVFKLPTNTDVDYIKRVIGLPGDRIQMIDGVLHINDAAVKKEPIGVFDNRDRQADGRSGDEIPLFRETLPNGVSYDVLGFDILRLEALLGNAAVHLERSDGGHDHGGGGVKPRLAALDVEEFLGSKIRAEASLGHHIIGELQSRFGRHHRVAAMGNVGEGAAMDEGRVVFQRLHQIGH